MAHIVLETGHAELGQRRLDRSVDGLRASTLEQLVHDQLRALVSAPGFPCLGGKAAFNRKTYRFALYQELGAPASAGRLGQDLTRFIAEAPFLGVPTTFLASFAEPPSAGERAFERLLWAQLQALHDLDQALWDPSASQDPDNARFAFSFGGQAFFVVGLHSGSSRWSRRFAWPTLAFNPMSQFEQLRATGRFGRFQRAIRAREMLLQGSINPNLEKSDACQYAGRATGPAWRCPLRVRSRPWKGRRTMQLFDISRTISSAAPTYPGDPPLGTEPLCVIGEDAPCNITRLTGWTTHVLTHVDAPLHFVEDGVSLDQIDLRRFIGNALVVNVRGDAIGSGDLPPREEIDGSSILFKTRNSAAPTAGRFDENHVWLRAEAAAELAAAGANLVGIDYLSIDRYEDEAYPAHRALLNADVLVLEGIDLAGVAPGRYTLVALPLKIAGGDGSPVRAVLLAGDLS